MAGCLLMHHVDTHLALPGGCKDVIRLFLSHPFVQPLSGTQAHARGKWLEACGVLDPDQPLHTQTNISYIYPAPTHPRDTHNQTFHRGTNPCTDHGGCRLGREGSCQATQTSRDATHLKEGQVLNESTRPMPHEICRWFLVPLPLWAIGAIQEVARIGVQFPAALIPRAPAPDFSFFCAGCHVERKGFPRCKVIAQYMRNILDRAEGQEHAGIAMCLDESPMVDDVA